MTDGTRCPTCQAPLSAGAPEGLCTRCAFERMLGALPVHGLDGARGFPRPFGDYQLLGEIARGGMGVVYRARQVTLDRPVALKVILSAHAASQEFAERFRVEARSAAGLDHPNIVPIYEIGEREGEPFFSMKLVEGETLAERCARTWKGGDRRPDAHRIRQFASLVATLARGVHYAHERGVLHRDIKPNNVLLDRDDTPYLTDFGLAKAIEADGGVTRTWALLGTPAYMAPEQARGEARSLTIAVDVYGLGAVLYELLTGRPPFSGGTSVETLRQVVDEDPRPPGRLNPSLDRDLETICLKCLEKTPPARYPSAAALADDLERWLCHQPIAARPSTPTERLRKWVRRRPGMALAAASALLAMVAVTVVSTFAAIRTHSARMAAEEANLRLLRNVRDLEWQKAEELAATGRTGASLAYLARLVRTSPDPSVPAARILSMLSLRNFPIPHGAPLQHGRGVTDLAFSPDGELLATGSLDGTIGLWALDGSSPSVRLEHPGPVQVVRFDPRGGGVLGVCRPGGAYLWDVAGGSVRREFPATELGESMAEFSPDGRYLVLRTGLHDFAAFETDTGDPVIGPVTGNSVIRSLAFSEAGEALLVATYDGRIEAFEVGSGRRLEGSWQLPEPVAVARFRPGGAGILAGGAGRIALWDHADGASGGEPRTIRTGAYEVIRLLVSPDGTRVVSLPYLEAPRLWTVAAGDALGEPMGPNGIVATGEFSPDGRRIVTGTADGVARIWDGFEGRPVLEPMQQDGAITRVRFSPDGQRVATASDGGTAQVWDVRMHRLRLRQFAGLPRIREVLFSPDGQWLYVSSYTNLLRRVAATGEPAGPPMVHEKQIFMGAISPDGRTLATITYNRSAHLWDASTFRERTPPLAHEDELSNVVFSPDGRLVVTTSYDRTARVWDVATGNPTSPPLPHPDAPLSCDFHPSGQRFVTGGLDGRVRFWASPHGEPVLETAPHRSRIWAVRFSPDGRWVASASGDRTVRMWDGATGQPVGEPFLHGKAVLTLRFSPDGGRLVTATEDGHVQLWDIGAGRAASLPMQHAGVVWNVAFSPDGRRLVSGSYDGTARIWDADSGYPMSEVLPHTAEVLRTAFTLDGKQLVTTASDTTLRYWKVLDGPPPVPEWLPAFAEAVGGRRLDASGVLANVATTELHALRRRLLAGTTEDYFSRWVRWFLTDRLSGESEEFEL
ncbi:MAG: protein kinase [Verrucomicrobiae bacterium]|nr:protein kinase [Verrucomicrobiae bacterium]